MLVSSAHLFPSFQITLMQMLPLKGLSRLAGWLAEKELPLWIRQRFFSWYIKKYECDMSEALEPDHLKYSSFQSFFGRELKPGVRTIDSLAMLTSPSDGTVEFYKCVKYLGGVDLFILMSCN